MKITQFDMFRNADAPLVGHKGSSFNWPGKCVTAQAVIFHAEALETLVITKAIWRLCWLPNINNGAQTAVRLVSADAGPSNIKQISAFFGSGNVTNPRNDAVDITEALNSLIASHRAQPTDPAAMFQLIHQTAGDGTHAPLIYSSAVELVF